MAASGRMASNRVGNFPFDSDAEYEQFAVDAAVAPGGVLPCQAKPQEPDQAYGPRSAGALGPGLGGVVAGEQVSMPAQHRFRAYRQLELAKHCRRKPVQQCREERPVSGGEAQSSLAQLAFQHGDLVP
jgi:hypothetical protein